MAQVANRGRAAGDRGERLDQLPLAYWPAVFLVYRRPVPPWTGLPTAGCYLDLVRRVVERRSSVLFVTYDRGAYRR
jgi:hypothetical protein